MKGREVFLDKRSRGTTFFVLNLFWRIKKIRQQNGFRTTLLTQVYLLVRPQTDFGVRHQFPYDYGECRIFTYAKIICLSWNVLHFLGCILHSLGRSTSLE